MFNQIKNLAGDELYLITSLLLFMVFFIIVTVYLLKLNKQYVAMMSNLPIKEQQAQEQQYEED